jgi:hypothetical protein
MMSIFCMQMEGLKPFNPILGETYQANIGQSQIYLEQTSHHPPIFNFYVKNPNFISYGFKTFEPSMGANSLSVEHLGKIYIQLNDGSLYRMHWGNIYINGLTMGKRTLNINNMYVEDLVKIF